MKKLIFFFHIILVILNNSYGGQLPQNYFISPFDFPLILSANFGELRTNAFHAGIDVRTGGASGKRVMAAADGFVYRIRVSPVGYGRALYVEHPNGLATVYAHLDEFNEVIEQYVRDAQYEQKSFDVDLVPPRGLLRVKQGEFIGFSGNTGSSSGPHLHFEIREASTQIPVNPLLFGFDIKDNLPPVLYTLAVYPMNHNSFVNGKSRPVFIPLTGSNGTYRIQGNDRLEVFGEIGFGIQVTDFLNDTPNRCGAWSIELSLGDQSIYSHELTKFAFGEVRYINSHIDYSERMRNRRDIQRAFLQPNNLMSIYGNHVNRGIGTFKIEGETNGKFIVKDSYKNKSELSFNVVTVIPDTETAPPPRPENFAMLMRYDQPNNYTNGDVEVSLPVNSLYDDLLFEFKTSPQIKGSETPVYHIHDEYTPVHRNYSLSIAAGNIPSNLREKALIVQTNGNNNQTPVTSQWRNGFVRGQTNVFGHFTVMIDNSPPSIEPLNVAPGRNMSNQNKISFRVKDDLSGIVSYNGFIDNEWVLFEFDPKNDHLFYVFDPERIGTGRSRNLELTVTDQKENTSVYSVEFYF